MTSAISKLSFPFTSAWAKFMKSQEHLQGRRLCVVSVAAQILALQGYCHETMSPVYDTQVLVTP